MPSSAIFVTNAFIKQNTVQENSAGMMMPEKESVYQVCKFLKSYTKSYDISIESIWNY